MLLYLIAAMSDVLDGFIARKMGIESSFGSKFDTISDVFFFVLSITKMWKLLHIQAWELIIFIVVIIKILSIVINRIFEKTYIVDVHSTFNKIMGILLFFLPMSIDLYFDKYYLIILLIFSIVAASDELIKVIKNIMIIK